MDDLKRQVLSGVNFHVLEGEFLSIIGTSGSGKTTLLRCLGGLQDLPATSTLEFRGARVCGPPEGVIMVFQDYASSLLPWRSIERNVALGLEGKVPASERTHLVGEALDMVGLTSRAHDYPWQLSGGMQQRVQLARALALRPSVLLLDEPFGSLDAMTKMGLQDELQRLHGQMETTVVFVTHDIEEAVYLSDRILVLGGTPGRLGGQLQVDLPRPRDQISTKEMPEYLRVRHDAYETIGRDD